MGWDGEVGLTEGVIKGMRFVDMMDNRVTYREKHTGHKEPRLIDQGEEQMSEK